MRNLLEPEPTFLPSELDSPSRQALDGGADPRVVAAANPAASLPWAHLARQSLEAGDPVAAYAFARTGYHRGLDALRKSGWRGAGPVPATHLPNQGVLLAIHALGEAAGAIGEKPERERCATLLNDCDPAAREVLGLA